MTRAKTFILLMGEELRLHLVFQRRYFFGSMTSIISNLVFMGSVLLVGVPSIGVGHEVRAVLDESNAVRLIGFLYFFLGMMSIGLPEALITTARQIGTIDSLALSPLGLAGVIGAQFLPTYIVTLMQLLVASVVLALVFGLNIAWSLGPIILNSLIAASGMLGLGYILGGLTIKFRQLGTTKNLLFVLLFLLGIMPVDYNAGVLSPLARFFPFTQGLLRTRVALIPGWAGTASVPVWLFVGCSLVLLATGLLIFHRFSEQSLRLGTLGTW